MKKKLLLSVAAAACLQAEAQNFTHAVVPVTGFSADVISDGSGTAASSAPQDFDGVGYNMIAQNYVNPANQTPAAYLPTGGLINSQATPGLMFQMQPYSANNSLRITTASNTDTLDFVTPRSADKINLLVTSAYGCTFSATIMYTDGTTEAFAGNAVPNWFDGTSAAIAIKSIGRIKRSDNSLENPANNPRIYQYSFALNTANTSKLIKGIKFTKTSTPANEVLHVFAVTASTLLPNDIGVSAITAPTGTIAPGVSQPVMVTVKNYGSAALNSATLGFSVNGTTVLNNIPFTASPALANNGVAGPVSLGNFTFPQGYHKLKAWTSMPNGIVDGAAVNDTLEVSVTSCNALAGNYTINRNSPASASNFTSFAAVQAILNSCGISGAVTFTVAPNSGPYNEQLVLDPVTGASATNTITFEGNGNTVLFAPGTTHQGVFTLNGADYVKINNFAIGLTAAATTGWGIQLKSNSDFNIISNNNLNLPLSSNSTSVNGIVFGTGYQTAGANGSNNLVQNNIINGGYAGISINGSSGNVGAVANEIKGNQVRDPFFYGIYLQNVTNNIVEGNDISRQTRTNGTTLYGGYLTGTSIGNQIRKNRVHNTHDVAAAMGVAYGFYTASPGGVGTENVFSNNLVYNANNTGNTFYGFYNVSASNTWYFHNTIVADNPAISYFTLRGMWFSSNSTNVKFINNNFSLTSTATNKHLIYLSNATVALVCNNNNLYKGTTGNIGYFSGDKATLADWKAANTNAYDQNSISENPGFTSVATGNLQPNAGLVNNIGQTLASVTDDITGAARPATTPDVGAYEFTPSVNDVSLNGILSPNSACGLSGQETVSVTLQNFGTAPQSNIPVSYTINGGTPVTETYAGPLAPGALVTYDFVTKANLSVPNAYTIVAQTNLTGDQLTSNDATSKLVNAIPQVTTYPYNENFETYNGGWLASGTASSWAWGTPAKPVINSAASGTKAYVTGLTGTYNVNEKSQVVGPCFNFTSLVAPVFEMKAWWNSEFSQDGAVLQSSIDGGTTWQKVGNMGDPNNWYNDNSINSGPGGQLASTAQGWTGRTSTSNGSNGWVTVKHALIGLGGQSNVKLRIAFGADGTNQDDGFAFDDVMIYESPNYDGGVTAITSPNSGCNLTNQETITITVKNFGGTPQSNIPVSYTINGGPAVNETVAGPIAAGSTVNYAFTTKADLSAFASYSIVAATTLAGDVLASNDSFTKVVVSSATPAIPTVTAGGSTTVCGGGSVNLTAASTTTGVTYQWFLNGTAISGATSATYAATATGNYTAIANSSGCSSAASTATAVTVNAAPAVPTITAGGPVTFCTGGSVTLTGASTTTGATYAWFLNGTAITGATSATYTANAAGNYTVVATAGGCSATSAATAITVNPIAAVPTVTAGGPTSFCTGGSVTLTAASVTTGATYAWYNNGTLIAGATSATYNATAAGNYTAVASVGTCASAPSTATAVTVNAAPAVPTLTAGGSTTFCSGGSVVLTATSTSTGATYTWSLNGTPISGATSATYTATAAGSYTATATSGACTATSTATTVTVNATPATPTVTQNGAVLTSSSATGNQWYLNGTAISGATSSTYTTTANGTYTVVVTAGGCSSTASNAVTITNTGLKADQHNLQVSVYPNPSNGLFNLTLPEGKAFELVVTDLSGKVVKVQTVKETAAQLNLNGAAKGVYILKLTSEGKTAVSKLIVE